MIDCSQDVLYSQKKSLLPLVQDFHQWSKQLCYKSSRMVAKFQLIILFFALTCHKLHASNFYSHVANFCFNNGGKQLIISGSSQMKNDIFKLAKTTQSHYLRIGYQSLIEIPTKSGLTKPVTCCNWISGSSMLNSGNINQIT